MAVGPFSISEVNQLVQHSPQIACPHLLTRTRIDRGPLTTEQQTGEHTRTRSQMPRSHTEKETYAIEKYSLDVRVSVQEKHTPAGNPLAGAPGPPERNTHPEKKKHSAYTHVTKTIRLITRQRYRTDQSERVLTRGPHTFATALSANLFRVGHPIVNKFRFLPSEVWEGTSKLKPSTGGHIDHNISVPTSQTYQRTYACLSYCTGTRTYTSENYTDKNRQVPNRKTLPVLAQHDACLIGRNPQQLTGLFNYSGLPGN